MMRALQAQSANSEGKKVAHQIWVDNLKNTLRRSWGAIGGYLAAPWAPVAAARRPRRPWTGPTTCPGGVKGLTDHTTMFDAKNHMAKLS